MKLEEGAAKVVPQVSSDSAGAPAEAPQAPAGRTSQKGQRLFDQTTVPMNVQVAATQIAADAEQGALADPSGTGIGAAFAVVVSLVRRGVGALTK